MEEDRPREASDLEEAEGLRGGLGREEHKRGPAAEPPMGGWTEARRSLHPGYRSTLA